MQTNLDKYKEDLDKLIEKGRLMLGNLAKRRSPKTNKPDQVKKINIQENVENKTDFENDYQNWYTESHALIRQIIPDRLVEFEKLYMGDGKRKEISSITFTIQDWLNGIRAKEDYLGKLIFDDLAAITMRFNTQYSILKSAKTRFVSSLHDIKQIVQADLFDSEIESAQELLKKGFLRGSGAIAGVVLEKHLYEVSNNHHIKISKKNPTISDYNDSLKNNSSIDIPTWRFIQRLGDLRNLCDHNKAKEPSIDEVNELINGVAKITKSVF
jgi:hypothetical protein